MRALLIRHAKSAHQAPDAPLSNDGMAQARDLVDILTQLGAGPLFSSPFRRAQETIAPFATASGQKVTVLDALRERQLSTQDLPDWQDHIRRSFTNPHHAGPGGETHADLQERASNALRKIAASGEDLPAFVTHGGLTSALFNHADPAFGFEDWKALRNPDLFAVEITDGQITAFRRIEMEVPE